MSMSFISYKSHIKGCFLKKNCDEWHGYLWWRTYSSSSIQIHSWIKVTLFFGCFVLYFEQPFLFKRMSNHMNIYSLFYCRRCYQKLALVLVIFGNYLIHYKNSTNALKTYHLCYLTLAINQDCRRLEKQYDLCHKNLTGISHFWSCRCW